MKKFLCILLLTLVLVMLFSVAALAAEADVSKNNQYEIVGANGAEATFELVTVDNTEHEKIHVTYSDNSIAPGAFYLVLMVTGDGSASSITGPNIKYIDQTVGSESKSIEFWVYPEDLAAGTIVITGTNITASDVDSDGDGVADTDKDGNPIKAVGMIAAIVNGKYVLGDVNGDGSIGLFDVVLILKDVAGVSKLTGNQFSAADVDKKGSIGLGDAVIILKVIAGLIKPGDL